MLQLDWLLSLMGACALFVIAFAALLSGKPLPAFLFLLGIPTLISHMIVFDYVRTRLAASGAKSKPEEASDTLGTPWNTNPGHTL